MMQALGEVAPTGTLHLEVIRGGGDPQPAPPPPPPDLPVRLPDVPILPRTRPLPWPHRPVTLEDVAAHTRPQPGLPDEVNRWRAANLPHFLQGWRRIAQARALQLPHFHGQLWIRVLRASGEELDYGLAGVRLVTTTGAGFIVDAFQNLVELENMKYHGLGTNNGAELIGNTALGAELTTQYNPDNLRGTGSLTEGASGNIFRTAAVNSVDSAVNITEHGVFSQAAVGGGVLLDRTMFTAIPLASGDGLNTTYDFTITPGG